MKYHVFVNRPGKSFPSGRGAFFPVLLVAFLAGMPLSAQTAAEMDVILGEDAVSGFQAARFVLGAAKILPEGLSGAAAEQAAWNMAVERGWAQGGASQPVRLDEAALLVMRAFNIKGGIMYRLSPGRRYAFREMVWLSLIQSRADPAQAVSGRQLLQLIGSTLAYSGGDSALSRETAAAAPAGENFDAGFVRMGR